MLTLLLAVPPTAALFQPNGGFVGVATPRVVPRGRVWLAAATGDEQEEEKEEASADVRSEVGVRRVPTAAEAAEAAEELARRSGPRSSMRIASKRVDGSSCAWRSHCLTAARGCNRFRIRKGG